MEAILRIRKARQQSGTTVATEQSSSESAFMKIRRLRRAAEESAAADAATAATAAAAAAATAAAVKIDIKKAIVKTGQENVALKSVFENSPQKQATRAELCCRKDCLLNVCGVSHTGVVTKVKNTVILRKRSEGALLSRGKPLGLGGARCAPMGAEAPSLPAKGGRPLTGPHGRGGLQVKAVKVTHQELVSQLARCPEKTSSVGNTLKEAESAKLSNLQHSVANSTASNYAYWWGRFSKFCDLTGLEEMPFSSTTVTLFLSHLAESAEGMGGVNNAKAALSFYFKIKFPDEKCPSDSEVVKAVLKGIRRRFQKPTNKKTPLSKEDFYKILATTTQNGNFIGVKLCQLRLAAQIALMFTTFSRYEESAALKCSQISKNKDDLVVTFLKGKTYQVGEARCAVIAAQTGVLNPVNVILAYMDRLQSVHKEANGFLFPTLTHSAKGDGVVQKPASYKAVNELFKKAVVDSKVAIDASNFGLHSMRRGAATSAANNGASDHIIQKQMRVSTVETVRRYSSLNTVTLKTACTAVFQKI